MSGSSEAGAGVISSMQGAGVQLLNEVLMKAGQPPQRRQQPLI